jgi:UDP:flavonoid glycosyltransferase YjiC (YdhE family)
VGLFSSHYVPQQADWPQPYEVTGFTFWDQPPGYELPEDVRDFLQNGPAPVLVSLGTSAASARPQLFAEAAEVLDQLDERGIFLTSTAHNGVGLRPSDRHGIWPFVPLEPLLRRCKAVVHSGAHGTNAMALRAGLPSVIRPCLQDQVWHARRQEQLGTGLAVRRHRLAPAIAQVLSDPSIAERAAALGEVVRSEDGPSVAAAHIDQLLA